MNKLDNPSILNQYRTVKKEHYNDIVGPRWRRLAVGSFTFPEQSDLSMNPSLCKWSGGSEELYVFPFQDAILKDDCQEHLERGEYFGIGEKFITHAEAMFNTGLYVHVPKNCKIDKPLMIEFSNDGGQKDVVARNLIIVEKNSELTLVMEVSSGEEETSFFNGFTQIVLKENAKVHFTKVQTLNDNAQNFDSNLIVLEKDAKFTLNHVELGSALSGTHYATHMNGTDAEVDMGSIYFLDNTRKLDLAFAMFHNAPYTMSNLEVFGALKDKARKVFRGDLNFKKGAKSSKGAEGETVVLLGDQVKSDAIPGLFCKEDDVEGQHAASVGKIDENKLFYLMSRGLTDQEARRTIIEASFMPVIDRLPNKRLQDIVRAEVSKRI